MGKYRHACMRSVVLALPRGLLALLGDQVGHPLLGAAEDEFPALVAGDVLAVGEEALGGESGGALWDFLPAGALVVLDDGELDLAVLVLADDADDLAGAPDMVLVADVEVHAGLDLGEPECRESYVLLRL